MKQNEQKQTLNNDLEANNYALKSFVYSLVALNLCYLPIFNLVALVFTTLANKNYKKIGEISKMPYSKFKKISFVFIEIAFVIALVVIGVCIILGFLGLIMYIGYHGFYEPPSSSYLLSV